MAGVDLTEAPDRGEVPVAPDVIDEADLQPITESVLEHLRTVAGGSFEIILDTRRAVVDVSRVEADFGPNTPSVPRIMFNENAAVRFGP